MGAKTWAKALARAWVARAITLAHPSDIDTMHIPLRSIPSRGRGKESSTCCKKEVVVSPVDSEPKDFYLDSK